MQDNISEMLGYSLKICMSLIQQRAFRTKVLRVLVELYLNLKNPDYINVCQVCLALQCSVMFVMCCVDCVLLSQCLIFLDDPQAVAEILDKLLRSGERDEGAVLMAYQIGFDLYESATQQFLKRVQDALRTTAPIPLPQSNVKQITSSTEIAKPEVAVKDDSE